MNLPSTYAAAGVDIEAGNEVVRRIKPHAQRTFTPGVLTGLGGFGALFKHDFSAYEEPLLVSATDGVGTKLKLAFALDKHDTVGIDLVAMCVNDVLCSGATPLFFLDYFATGKIAPEAVEAVVKGIADGCEQSGCALIGGETAELPGFYSPGEYDLAGFTVGVVDKKKVVTGESIASGDVLLGLPSSGLHSNGYSLARKVLEPLGYDTYQDELGRTVGEALLTPTRLYVKPVLDVLKEVELKGIVHITGGGFYENIPRILPKNTIAAIDRDSWVVPAVFGLIQERAQIAEREMYTTFNMGIGMVLALNGDDVDTAQKILGVHGLEAQVIGRTEEASGEPRVELV